MSQPFYTGIDGVKNVWWRPLRLANATATYNQATVFSATDLDGVWTLTLNPSGAYPAWEFDPIPALQVNQSVLFLRFRDTVAPAVFQDIAVYGGLVAPGVGPFPGLNVGYEYNAIGGNVRSFAYLTGAPPPRFGTGIAAFTHCIGHVSTVDGTPSEGSMAAATVYGGTTSSVSWGSTVGYTGSALMIVAHLPAAGAQDTFAFRPEYAVVNYNEI